LLQGALVAAISLPLALFLYAAWLGYDSAQDVADRQIERTTDAINEHALKVFEAVERTVAEINEIIRGMSDAEITAEQSPLHERLQRLADGSSQIKSVWIFDRHGHALVNSLAFPVDTTDFSDRDYFKAHIDHDIGTFVGAVLRPRPPYGGAPFFGVSRRRTSPDGAFTGVIQASILPEYFEGFYAKLAREPGAYASLARQDGLILARYPSLGREVRLAPQAALMQSMRIHPLTGQVSLISAIDGTGRKVAYRKLDEFPVYVLAGLETAAIRNQWLSQLGSQLIFGLPATAALIGIIALALRRTRRLYAEAAGRQSAEEALKQSQRLEALGQLTGGVAHDFNNLLMVIGGSAARLKSRISDDQGGRSLAMIDAAVQKGERLTRQLLSFSRRQTLSPQVIDVADCIKSFLDVLNQPLRADVTLELRKSEEIIVVKVDRDELEIALLNLTLNARDAMPDGGRITISVGTVWLDRGEVSEGLHGEFAVIAVSDTGVGIPEGIREHIFEPYFTTKKVDKGTGLGLSQVYGFAQQSGGTITVESEVGRGTTFRLLMPRSYEPIEMASTVQPSSMLSSRPARVLLVEDNPDVAVVASDYLEQCGCTVLRAGSAESALELLNKESRIDVIFSDIVMPGLSGLELGRLVREHHPEIPVILASGYSDKAADAVREGFALLNKPYSVEDLRNALAEVGERLRHAVVS
jgi:two-component system NtrC family sensor kinase